MSDKYDKIISAILRSSKTEASEADLKIGMVNIKLTAELDTSVHVTHITNFLSVPENKKSEDNFTKRPRILVCFFSDADEANVTKFNTDLKEINEKSSDFKFKGEKFTEKIYIYLNKKEEVEVVDKSFTVDGHTIYINDTDTELVVDDYKKMKKGNIILNNNTDTAPTPPLDSLPLENAPSPDTVTGKLNEMGYKAVTFPIYEVRDNEKSETDPFLSNLCVEDLAVGAVGEADTGGSKTAAMKGPDQYPVPGISSLEGASGGREYAAEGKAAEAAKAAAKKEAEAAKAAKKGGSRSKRNRKRSRGGGRKRKNKRSKKRKYMRSKKRKKLQRR